MRIEKDNTIAVVIDYQERLVPVMSDPDKLINRTKVLLCGVKALEIPIIVTEQYPKGMGKTIDEIEEITADCAHYEKLTFSVWDTPQIRSAIEAYNRTNIIICGIEAHVCVMQTALDLAAAGYVPVWVGDCISSRRPSDMEIAERRAIHEGAVITSAEGILFELTRVAGTDVFKVISRLVK